MKKLLHHENGITTIYHKSGVDSKFTVQRTQDVQPFLENNAKIRSSQSEGWKGDLHEVADIPFIVWEQWWREFGGNPGSKENRPRMLAKLNSNEFSYLRTKEGRL